MGKWSKGRKILQESSNDEEKSFPLWKILCTLFGSTTVVLAGLFFLVALLLILFIGGSETNNNSTGSRPHGGAKPLSPLVEKWRPEVTAECERQGIPHLVDLALAIMQVESGGNDPDLMQSSESAGYPAPGYLVYEASIEQGIKHLKNANDIFVSYGNQEDVLGVAQTYNFGLAYGQNLKSKGAKHTVDQAEDWSKNFVAPALGNHTGSTYPYINEVSVKMGKTYLYWNGGNYLYAYLVEEYLPDSGGEDGENSWAGSNDMVEIALSQVGQPGDTYWSWYGFSSRQEWCATFVSWVANQAGVPMEKFAYCPTGIDMFKRKNQWVDKSQTPEPGYIVFFDFSGSGVSEHVAIVKEARDGKIYTIDGNYNDIVAEASYSLAPVMGYGVPQ